MSIDVHREVLRAEERIRPHVRETPVDPSPVLGRDSGAEVWLKLENVQLTGSFKLRGAMNKLLSLASDERQRGVVAASSGNHGAAVAYALTTLGCPGLIFVPEDASPAKLAAIRAYGAEVRQGGDDCVVAEARAQAWAEEHRQVYISPYNDPRVMGGQGTVGVELARQLGGVDAVFVSLGGGGLTSGVAGYLKALGEVEIVACSAENSRVMHESVAAGRILDLPSSPTLSDGTAGGVEAGSITFELCRRLVDRYVLVSEAEIADAMRLVVEHHHQLVEGAAGVAVAGFLKERQRYAGRRVAIVLCGANVSRQTLCEVLCGD